MVTSPTRERRGGERVECLMGALAEQSNPRKSYKCFVKDMSDGGCRLVGVDIAAVRSPFVLFLAVWPDGRRCEVAWRRKRMIGVQFGDWVGGGSPRPA